VEKEGKEEGGYGVFPPSAELVVERAMRERHRLGLFIGRLGRCPDGEIFLTLVLIHHSATWLTLSCHIALLALARVHAGATLAATLMALHRSDHGIDH
jgi:hypothetical protein